MAAGFWHHWQACSEAYGITEEDLSALAVKAYGNASKNPLAHMHAVNLDMAGAVRVWWGIIRLLLFLTCCGCVCSSRVRVSSATKS
jgi:hypothetical protein